MTAKQWARVFRAGANAIQTVRFRETPGLYPELYPVAALSWSLTAMADEAEKISEETR